MVGRPSRYDVCPVVGLRAGSAVDLAVVLQDDQLSDLATRVVAPLIALQGHDPESRVHYRNIRIRPLPR